MKVVLATDACTAGGVGRHLRDLADGLLLHDVDVQLAAPRGSKIVQVAAELGVRFRPFEDGLTKADIWHLHLADTYYRPSLRVLANARVGSRRVVVTEHLPRSNASDATLSDDARTPGAALAKTAFKKLQLGLAHSVIAVSAASRRFLLDRYGLAPARVVSIHNGVDLSRFRAPAGPPVVPRQPSVVAVGSLIRQKGHDVLIRASAVARHDWTVVVAGTGPQHEDLKDLAAKTAPGRVAFSGWVDDIPGLMRQASVVCMPSRWESFAYVPLEAMAMGLPVVASRVDGVDEAVAHERSGLLVEPDDPQALAAAIDRVMADAELSRVFARNARQDVAEFDVAVMVRKTVNHYRSLL
ncbi:glycosyltransferase family 4 protein [Actinoplanes sp. N902-109]|uniref:glycosyltransferase family 4 protein n=1 Tax=Actinoplanes sp. (strain N902-109) TaxID=649831 RepID=UPI000329640E|nr:glycosyltransferase family 4 protein [Actinoplanes sp. N902-109]AGL20843.1 group 1 glycosyl transferase [Actinoplanes sp. N902-109]